MTTNSPPPTSQVNPVSNPSPNPPSKSSFAELFGAFLLIIGILIFLSLSSFQGQLSKGLEPLSENNLIGSFGHSIAELLFLMFGKSSFLLGPYVFVLGGLTISRSVFSDPLSRVTAIFIMMVGSSILGGILYAKEGVPSQIVGGVVGAKGSVVFMGLFGVFGSKILSFGVLMGGAVMAIRMPISVFFMRVRLIIQYLIKRYGEMFQGSWNLDFKLPTTSVSRTPSPLNMGSLFKKESDTQRPWIERVENLEEVENTPPVRTEKKSQVSEPLPEPFLEKKIPPSSYKENENKVKTDWDLRISERTRNLHELLSQWNGNEKSSDEGEQEVVEGFKFEGHFDPDGSRFHFKSHDAWSVSPQIKNYKTNYTRVVSKASVPTLLENPRIRTHDIHILDLHTLEKKNSSEGHLEKVSQQKAERQQETYFASHPNQNFIENEWGETPTTALEPESPESYEALEDQEDHVDVRSYEKEEKEKHLGLDLDSNYLSQELSKGGDIFKVQDIEDKGRDEIENETYPFHQLKKNKDFEPKDSQFEISKGRELREDELVSKVPELDTDLYTQYQIDTSSLQRPNFQPPLNISNEITEIKVSLEKVMHEYGIQAEVVGTERGPIITLYEIKLEPGIKLSRVLSLQNEICMNLAVPIVRIIAPIPGKSTIGIEIPNRIREPVLLSQLLPSPKGELQIVLGKNIAGINQYVDLSLLPHLLIAGATGAGKSVYLNTVIASLLYHSSPLDVRLVMIDPKMVELKLYEGIPHLLMPVITDVYEASKALRWLIDEMERRYRILSALRCRDIRSYNQRIQSKMIDDEVSTKMPYIVVIIDELSDLMMVAAKDVEDSIIRLTQKARAVGLHIIMATQRPSVDVITALIKANCPARIAFQVAQRTDSRTILDANGAENLLGRGDFIYKSPLQTSLVRIQAPLVTEEEIEALVKQMRSLGPAKYVTLSEDTKNLSEADEQIDESLFQEALAIVLESGKTSTSYIQRRLRIGYNKAANIMELMEDRGYLSPTLGAKAREILKRS